jgi:hypothetical protein
MTQTCSRFFSLRGRIILLAVLFVGCFVLLSYFSNVGFTQNADNSETLQKDIQQPDNVQDETPHWLVGSFYTTQNGITGKLLLNNKGITPLEARPTLYNLAGQQIDIPPVVVEARSFRFINLQDWASIGGESFQSGSIKLFHTGRDLVLGAQIYLTDEAHSLSFEEKLAELGKFDSRQQEAVWFQPTNQTETVVVLSNTSDASLTVTARLSKRPQQTGSINTFQLAAHETRILSLRQDFSDGQQFANSDVVGLSLEHTGAKSDLLARVGIADAGRGYSNLAQFSNPAGGKSSEYQGVGFQIDEIAGERLTPVIVAKNVGTQTATITTKVPYTRADGTTGTISLPQTSLQAGEMKTLNVQQIIQRANQEQIKIAGLEITYNTVAGSVIVAAHSQTANLNQVFRVPMWDPMNQRSPTGGYPWRIETTSTTKTYIKNITDREQYYVAHLNWENGGEYVLGMKKLLPNQTIEIDIKKLRDEQTPDEAGRTIPSYIASGQLKWSMKQTAEVPAEEEARQQLALIGRTEQIDVINGISSNYACQNCCGDSYYDSYVTPYSVEVEVDQQLDFDVYQADINCYGEISPYYRRTWLNGSTTWGSRDTSVATMNGSNATAVGAGDTTISATWTDYFREMQPSCGGTYFTESGEQQCETDKEQTSEIKEEPPLPNLAPPCGGCRSYIIRPRPIAYLSVRPVITITRNGNPITAAQNVIVGQQMNLSATVKGGTPSNHQWIIPGTKVADYVVTCTIDPNGYCNPTSAVDTPLTNLSNSSISYYWIDGADSRQVRYTATIRGRQYSKTAIFNVKRPTARISASTSVVQLTTFPDGYGLWFGNYSTTTPGIGFTRTVTMPTNFNGDLQWVQTWNKFRRINIRGSWYRSVGQGLDSLYPYETGETAEDSPGIAFGRGWQEVEINDSFQMWLMFKPTGVSESTIWVPLSAVNWSFSGKAVFSGTTWQLMNPNPSQPTSPPDADSITHPRWTQNPATIDYSLEQP